MAIAFFDLDKTLLDCNSGRLWVRSEFRDGRVGVLDLTRVGWWLLQYKMGIDRGIESAIREAATRLAGLPEPELAARSESWFDREVRPRIRPGALTALAQHRQAGDMLVLATSASQYVARQASIAYGLDDYICTELDVNNEQFTGRIASMAYGDHKADRVAEWAADKGTDLAGASFYTDSITDLLLMQQVDHPVAINPDRRLRRHAEQEGWAIEDWGMSAAGRALKAGRHRRKAG